VLVRPLLAAFRRGTGDSVLLVALLPSAFNRTNNQNGIAAMLWNAMARPDTTDCVIAVRMLGRPTTMSFVSRSVTSCGSAACRTWESPVSSSIVKSSRSSAVAPVHPRTPRCRVSLDPPLACSAIRDEAWLRAAEPERAEVFPSEGGPPLAAPILMA
jgi:hypothetical protein